MWLLAVSFLVSALYCTSAVLQATMHVVFVHGTFVPGLCAVTNPLGVYSQNYQGNSTYTRTLKKLRADKAFFHSSIMYLEGFHAVADYPAPSCQQHAAYQIAQIFRLLDPETPQKFYTFGWNGELALEARRVASKNLYQALSSIKLRPGDSIELICHSHGGNVAAYLVEQENQLHKNLVIERLILLGTPIQPETELLFANAMFRNVWALWSKKDIIIISDTFSTPSRVSYRSLVNRLPQHTPNHVHDIDIRLEGRPYFGHRALFYFGIHLLPYSEWFYRSHHRTLHHFRLLPLAIVIPMLRKLVPAFDERNSVIQLNIKSDQSHWFLNLHTNDHWLVSRSYHQELAAIHTRLEREWLPCSYTRELFTNAYAGWCGISACIQDFATGIYVAFSGLFQVNVAILSP